MISHISIHTASASIITTIPDDEQQCCNTSISKHVELRKGALFVLPREIKDGLLLLSGLIATFILTGSIFKRGPDDFHQFQYKLYTRNNLDHSNFNYLKVAFARGILNPKIH